MKVFTLICAFLFAAAAFASAEEGVVEGGKSPDGRYEVRQTDTVRTSGEYTYAVVATKTGKPIGSLAAQFAGVRVLWHTESRFLAVSLPVVRHTMVMSVYEINDEGKLKELSLPDFTQNALGRVGALSVYRSVVIKPLRWDGDDLHCDLYFDARSESGGIKGPYTVDFTLKVDHTPNTATNIMLTEMGKPKDVGP